MTLLDLEKQEGDIAVKVDSLIYDRARGESVQGKEGIIKRFFK